MENKKVSVSLQTVPFQGKRDFKFVELESLVDQGIDPNLEQIFKSLGIVDFTGFVEIDGKKISRHRFSDCYPHPGAIVNLVRVPLGGGGSEGGKSLKKTITAIGILAVSSWIAGPILGGHFGLWAGGSIQAGLATTATAAMLSSALIKPQRQNAPSNYANNTDPAQRSYSITRFRNTPNPNGVYPVIYGKHKVFPPPGAEPYTEIVGHDIYFRQLFIVGYGPLDISSIKIGETAIGSYSDVSYNVFNGWPDDSDLSIYTNDIETTAVDALVENGTPVTRTTEADTTRISVDLCFKEGLFELNANGTISSKTVVVTVETSPTGAGSWTLQETVTCTEGMSSVAWKNSSFDIASGQYDVRITRTTADSTSDSVYDKVHFFALKSIKDSAPITIDGMAMIELRIKATDQLNGIIDTLSCVAEAYVPVYLGQYTDITADNATNGWTSSSTNLDTLLDVNDYIQISGFTDNDNNWNSRRTASATMAKVASVGAFAATFTNLVTVADEAPGDTIYIWKLTKTRNPAWAYTDVARGKGTLNPIADTRLSIAKLNTWATNCTAAGYTFDLVLDAETTQRQLMDDIASTGRGSFSFLDGKLSIVEDVQQTTVKQMITTRNSWGLSGHKSFYTQPHAFRLQFVNEDTEYEWDERILYASGYNANTAKKFETIRLIGVTDPDQVWKESKYRLAVITHRQEVFSVNMDFERMLIDERGNLVLLAHDGISVGLKSTRITAVTTDGGGDCTHITVDETCTMAGGTDYGVTVRLKDNTYIVSEQVVTNAGDQTTLEFTTPIDSLDPQPEIGDLAEFGEYESETIRCIVTGIKPRNNDSASIMLTNEGPAVYTADSGVIPGFSSNITIPAAKLIKVPPVPTVLNIRSDESVMIRQGRKLGWITRALISFAPATEIGISPHFYQVRWKRSTDQTQWHKEPAVSAEANEISVFGLDELIDYDFQVRSISQEGIASLWDTDSGNLTGYTFIGKSSDPSDVADLAVAIQGEKIRLTWTKVVDKDVQDYAIRYGATGDSWADMSATEIRTGDTDSWLFDSMTAGTYKFAIKAVDTSAAENYSDTEDTDNLTITGPLDAVDDGTFADLNKVELRWRDCTQSFPIQHYEVRRGSTYASSSFIGFAKATLKTVIEQAVGEYTYWIKAIDVAGNESSNPLSITMSVLTPPGVALIENITDDLTGTSALCKRMVLGGVPTLFAPVNITETWEDHFVNNSASTFQDLIDSGYTKFGEPTPNVTDAGDGTTTCYYYANQLNHGVDFDTLLTSGCKIKFEMEKVDEAGEVGVYTWITINGLKRDGATSYSQSIMASEITADSTFGVVNQINVSLYFFPLDNSGNNLARMWDMKTLIVYPVKEEAGEVSTNAAGYAELEFDTIFSDIDAVVVTPKTSSDYRAQATNFSCDGSNVTFPATADIYQKNAAGAGVAGACNYYARGK